MSRQAKKRHGGTINASLLCEGSQAAKATSCVTPFQDILENTGLWREKRDQWSLELGEGGMSRWSTEDFILLILFNLNAITNL